MIKLFDLPEFEINSANLDHILHSSDVTKFETNFADFVGAKYACSVNSATSAIFLSIIRDNPGLVRIPSMIPPVVCNAILTANCKIEFYDDTEWVGSPYVLHEYENYKIIDSAQCVRRNQFKEVNSNDLMIFSFYPTKPIGGCDGGMIVSDDLEKINWFKAAVLNGMSFAVNNWDRKIIFPGYKMYMNSIQSIICMNQLNKYESKLIRLNEIKNYYNNELNLSNTSDHLYRINVKNNTEAIEFFKQKGIQSGIHYAALDKHDVYRTDDFCPNSQKLQYTCLSIPFNANLKDHEVEIVVNEAKKIQA